jgi:proteasome lid subunit RPN8/RPN11
VNAIVLPENVRAKLASHARREAPREAVGLIAGTSDGMAVASFELPNLGDRDEFFADPYAQYQAEVRIAAAGLRILAIYHSHPGGGTGLSLSDRLGARRWSCAQVVIVPGRTPAEPDRIHAYSKTKTGIDEVLIRQAKQIEP